MKETLNARVRRYRKLSHYSQAYVAEMVGLKASTYSQMERTGRFTCEMLLRLSNVLNVEPQVLLLGDESGEMEENNPTVPRKPEFKGALCKMELTLREYHMIDIFRHLNEEKKSLVSNYILDVFHTKNKKSTY